PQSRPAERRICPIAIQPRIVVPNGAVNPSGSSVNISRICHQVGPLYGPWTTRTLNIAKKAAKKNGDHAAPTMALREKRGSGLGSATGPVAAVGGPPTARSSKFVGRESGGPPDSARESRALASPAE